MSHYVVLMPEFHLTEVFIEANSHEEAKEIVQGGDGEYGFSYYRHTIEVEDWEVYDIDADDMDWIDRERELRETSTGF